MTGKAHVIGGGLAGLSAALRLAEKGMHVTLHEATARAGGRCRSFHDAKLDCEIDNGNHLLMSGNRAALAYVRDVGAEDRLVGPPGADFPFVDRASGERWTLHLNRGPIPFWLFDAKRRVPGTKLSDYASGLRLLWPRADATIAECFDPNGPLYRRFWEPLAVAAINMPPDEAAARLLRPVLLETFARGAGACRPLIAKESLADTLVDPALDRLRALGVDVRFNDRLLEIGLDRDDARYLEFSASGVVGLDAGDAVVLAVPPAAARSLLPHLAVPPDGDPIVNVHYRLGGPPAGAPDVGLVGVIGGFAHWVFIRGRLASVTISAGRQEAALAAEDIANRAWDDVRAAFEIAETAPPPYRVIKERRATFAQSPAALRQRPAARTAQRNLFLAGDWIDTGLPATIEGAIRSGERAAKAAAKIAGKRSVASRPERPGAAAPPPARRLGGPAEKDAA